MSVSTKHCPVIEVLSTPVPLPGQRSVRYQPVNERQLRLPRGRIADSEVQHPPTAIYRLANQLRLAEPRAGCHAFEGLLLLRIDVDLFSHLRRHRAFPSPMACIHQIIHQSPSDGALSPGPSYRAASTRSSNGRAWLSPPRAPCRAGVERTPSAGRTPP